MLSQLEEMKRLHIVYRVLGFVIYMGRRMHQFQKLS